LVDVVAFGLPGAPPERTRTVLKGVRPGIEPTDHVVLWGGGVYNWFDPLTLIRAMARISAQRDDVKLVFLGIRHPNPDAGGSEMADQAIALSQGLDLYEKTVFFNDWTPYDERQNYLLEADAGVSLHFAHLETHFSFRTRLLDYVWAALPIIVTRGDVLSALVEQHRLGWVVDYESVDDVVAAILESAGASRGEFHDRFAAIAPQLHWDVVMQPLVDFCREPRCAPDRERARTNLSSLAALKLTSQIDALRRDVNERDRHITNYERMMAAKDVETADLKSHVAALSDEIERLQQVLGQIREGRVMRLLNSINRFLIGGPPE
jgi:hypothetical protein